MTIIVLPDPLVWQAGIEYGLQALAVLNERRTIQCYLRDSGVYLEAIAFAVNQLGLRALVQFAPDINHYVMQADLLLLPRVAPMPLLDYPIKANTMIVTSDETLLFHHENISFFPRREYRRLATLINSALVDCVER